MEYDFCTYRASGTQEHPCGELFFYGDIVSDEWECWSQADQYPANICRLLKEIGDSDLEIHINSAGGDVFAGFAICNMLRSCKGRKTVCIDGLAASVASVIAMAGDEILMPANAYMMIHKAWTAGTGNADELRKLADTLEKIDEGICTTYLSRAKDGTDAEVLRQKMAAETWLTAAEASEMFANITVLPAVAAAAGVKSEMLKRYAKLPTTLQNRCDAAEETKRYAEAVRAAYL